MSDLDNVLAGVGLRRDDVTPNALVALEQHLQTAPTMNDLIRGGAPMAAQPASSTTDAAPTDAALDVLRIRVGDDLGLHHEVRALLRGDTYDQLVSDAHRLADLFAKVEPPAPVTAVPSGPRGTEHELSGAEEVNAMLRSASGRTFP